jgi:hypothetical protein
MSRIVTISTVTFSLKLQPVVPMISIETLCRTLVVGQVSTDVNGKSTITSVFETPCIGAPIAAVLGLNTKERTDGGRGACVNKSKERTVYCSEIPLVKTS